ncbi:hypothetical protein K438DRAFT_2030935 [Mycena galopus ATCC 62051]|nr:hypothetical protein K438DRAFT_2030935 [Mycena galopus ATCC 62051]
MTILPQELIEHIIDLLWDDSYSIKDLKACSLVCREWLPRCRSHLFESTTLTRSTVVGFRDLLRSPAYHPFLQYLHRLRVTRSSWDAVDQPFDEIVTHLRCLDIRQVQMQLLWKNLADAETFSRMRLFTAFSNVTQLVLYCASMDVEQPAAPLFDLICHFPALQDLRLLTMGANWGHPATGASPPQRLRKLALLHEISAPVLSWLHTFHILSNLDSLLLARMQSDDVPAVRTAMQQISSTLRHLTINLDGLHTDGTFNTPRTFLPLLIVHRTGTFDFSRYSNLQTLRIRWWDLRPD